MKLLLAPFGYYSKRYHTNKNISEIKLLLVPFGYHSKKLLDDVYKYHAVIFCISILMLHISLKLVGLNIYFYDFFF